MIKKSKMSPLEIVEAYIAKTDPKRLAKIVEHFSSLPSKGPTFNEYLNSFSEVFENEFSFYLKLPENLNCYKLSNNDNFYYKYNNQKELSAHDQKNQKHKKNNDPLNKGHFFCTFYNCF